MAGARHEARLGHADEASDEMLELVADGRFLPCARSADDEQAVGRARLADDPTLGGGGFVERLAERARVRVDVDVGDVHRGTFGGGEATCLGIDLEVAQAHGLGDLHDRVGARLVRGGVTGTHRPAVLEVVRLRRKRLDAERRRVLGEGGGGDQGQTQGDQEQGAHGESSKAGESRYPVRGASPPGDRALGSPAPSADRSLRRGEAPQRRESRAMATIA